MNDRLSELRAALSLTTRAFGARINLTGGAVTNMEKGTRSITDRTISDICREYSVNEEWLRTGIGEMFAQNDESVLAELTREYNLDNIQQLVIESVLQMNDMERNVLKKFVHGLVDKALDDKNYEEFRSDYIKENAAPAAARDGNISGIAEAAALYDASDDEDKDEN